MLWCRLILLGLRLGWRRGYALREQCSRLPHLIVSGGSRWLVLRLLTHLFPHPKRFGRNLSLFLRTQLADLQTPWSANQFTLRQRLGLRRCRGWSAGLAFVNDTCFFILLPLILLGKQRLLQFIPSHSLLRTASHRQIAFTAEDVLPEDVWRNVLFLLCFAKAAELREEFWLVLTFSFRWRTALERTPEVCHRLCRLWLGCGLRLRS